MLRLFMLIMATAVFSLSLFPIPNRQTPNITLELPAPGHWLMTSHDLALAAASQPRHTITHITQPKAVTHIAIPKPTLGPKEPPQPPPKSYFHGNRSQDNINVAVLWVDGKKLKAFTITTINPSTRKAAVAGIPLFAYHTGDKGAGTVAQLYHRLGTKAFLKKMAVYLETDIDYNIVLEHSTFVKISELVGSFTVGEETTTCLQIFEETAADKRTDDEQVVQAVAAKVLARESWLIIPKIVFILTRELELNMSPKQMYELYQEIKRCNTDQMQKNSLAGQESYHKGKRTRAVEPEQWANILYSLTN